MLQELSALDLYDRLDLYDPDDERDRADERVNVPYPARVIVGDEHEATAMTAHLVNLSDNGAALRVYGRLAPGDAGRIMIDMGGAPVVISMRAVWTRVLPGGRLVGVTFHQLSGAHRVAIAKLLADHES